MKKIIILLMFLMAMILFTSPILADADTYVHDFAQILSTEAKQEINDHLTKISQAQKTNVHAALVYSTYGEDVKAHADTLLQDYLAPLTQNQEGSLLLVVLDSRDWVLVTDSYASNVITKAIINDIEAEIVPLLSAENYSDAFKKYGSSVEAAYKNKGKVTTLPKKTKEIFSLKRLITSLIIGSIIALLMASGTKSRLKSVVKQRGAKNYLVKSNLKKEKEHDLFLYEKVTKKPKAKKDAPEPKKVASKGKF